MVEKIKEFLRNNYFKEENEGKFVYRVYADYDEYLGIRQIKEIIESGCPMDAFKNIMADWSSNLEDYYYSDLISNLERKFDRDLSEAETEWINQHVSWRYDNDHFLNQTVKTNIYVASKGCRNKDFVCDNILNYYGTDGGYWKGDIDEDSCMLWLAKQFDQEENFRKAVLAERVSPKEISYDKGFKNPFIDSCMQELYNLPSHMSCLCFLVSMTVRDIIDWYSENKGIKIGKKSMCGLYDPWFGGGSLLEIELPNELIIPKEMVWDVCPDGTKLHGYDVDEVYGLIGSCWNAEGKVVA